MTDPAVRDDPVHEGPGAPWVRVLLALALGACAIWAMRSAFGPSEAGSDATRLVAGPGFTIAIPGTMAVVDDADVVEGLIDDPKGRAVFVAVSGPEPASSTRVAVVRTAWPFPAPAQVRNHAVFGRASATPTRSHGRAAYRLAWVIPGEGARATALWVDGASRTWLVVVIVGPAERTTDLGDVDRILDTFELAPTT